MANGVYEATREKVLARLAGTPAADLHYAYGANCYQDAIGCDTVILHGMQRGEDPDNGGLIVTYFNYMALVPGNIDAKRSADTFKHYREAVIQGCIDDGLQPLGKTPVFKSGYRTLKLYFRPHDADFHFEWVRPNGTARAKIPFSKVTEYAVAPDNAYEFEQYFLCPPMTARIALQRLGAVSMVEKLEGTSVRFAFIRPQPNGKFTGSHVKAFEDLNSAVHAKSNMPLLMPALPNFRTFFGQKLTYQPVHMPNAAWSRAFAQWSV